MDRLPLELLSFIVQVLANDAPRQLSAYAGISRAWQGAIEQQTFRTLDFPVADLDAFRVLFDSPNACRVRFLVRLDVNFGRQGFKDFYSTDDTAEFSNWVAKLFTILADFATRATNLPALMLRFYASGYPNLGSFGVQLPASVPQVHHVRRFELQTGGRLHALRQSPVFAILAKLPSVHKADLEFSDDSDWNAQRRRAEREAFGDAICAADLSSLQELQVWIHHTSQKDENRTPDYLFPESGPQYDAYSRALRHLATFTLTKVHLLGPLVIGVDFFANLPAFPALVDFQLDFAPETADGRWFFVRDMELRKKIIEEEGEDEYEDSIVTDEEDDVETDEEDSVEAGEEDEAASHSETSSVAESDYEYRSSRSASPRVSIFRTLPNPSTLNPLLLSAAQFVTTSPRLRKFVLNQRDSSVSAHMRILWNHESMARRFELWFLRAGTEKEWPKVPADAKYMAYDRMYWNVSGSWRPDGDVERAWRETVKEPKVFFLRDEGWVKELGRLPAYLADLEDVSALV